MTAADISAGLHGRRTGPDTYQVLCPVHEADGKPHNPSCSIRQRGDKVLVHCQVGCSQADVIDALRARGLWPRREQPDWTPAERADWARQQRELELVLPDARYWRQAMVNITEELLVNLKAALFDPTLPRPGIGEIYHVEGMLTRLRARDGADLVAEYKSWCASQPGYTAMMVRAAKDRERANERVLRRYLREMEAAG